MSALSSAPSPNISELMRLFSLDEDADEPAEQEEEMSLPLAPPPAPLITTRSSPASVPIKSATCRAPQMVAHRDVGAEMPRVPFQRAPPAASGGWNSSTQVAKTLAKPLKHQILCRNYVPSAGPAVAVDRKAANQLLQRLSKATISSRMKDTAAPHNAASTVGGSSRELAPANAIDVDRKRMHLQQRHVKDKTRVIDKDTAPNDIRSSREGIELLLFYRKEVEKRLRADPLYALRQDMQPY